ncbi:unnamed protein product [Rotaria sp. Silwood1]|nr:unnamed protein product [Rotaria sp. Silwood1]CAF1645236.1 unnamed protein product [Rotaria sp. Silwood1]CAF1645362.1 unnamed protein product [Rotaria sp. Silwood1]CAF3443435.1 unnamed protein product [Rotaria sp. Silwood1]CAF3845021.1 unnamed protein product [Rotaria sp. Silwood1]
MVGSMTYRLQKYDSNNWVNGTTIFGESVCGSSVNQFCGCIDIFVDRQGAIYCSDNAMHRVIKITPNNQYATVAAGVTNTSGSQLNQLNNPQGIFVDANYTLYVIDAGNSRILAFSQGNPYGRYLFYYSSGIYMGYAFLTLDNSGSVYTFGNGTVNRWTPSTSISTSIVPGTYFSYYGVRIRLDSKGNIYTKPATYDGINKYNIVSNTC